MKMKWTLTFYKYNLIIRIDLENALYKLSIIEESFQSTKTHKSINNVLY